MKITSALRNLMTIISLNRSKARMIALDVRVRGADIGQAVHIAKKCVLNNTQIGDYSYLGEGCRLSRIKIGKFCSIASEVVIAAGNHPLDAVSTSPATFSKGYTTSNALVFDNFFANEYHYTDQTHRFLCEIGNDVWIGARATLVCSNHALKIGNGAVIAAGAVVVDDVPPYAIVGGVPAKLIRYRFNSQIREALLNLNWWDRDKSWLQSHVADFIDPAAFVNRVKQEQIEV